MSLKKPKKALPVEQGSFRDQVKIGGKTHHRDVSEKMGADGIIETHVSYALTERKYYGHVKDSYCGLCSRWITKNYKWKGHKKGCKSK